MTTDNLLPDERELLAKATPDARKVGVWIYSKRVVDLLSRLSALRVECRDREAAWAKAASGEESAMARVERREDLCIRLASHIRNTDEIPPTSWAVTGMDLLGEVRSLNPRRYDAEVKGPAASRDEEKHP